MLKDEYKISHHRQYLLVSGQAMTTKQQTDNSVTIDKN